jgi:hypothetical protein
VEAALTEGGMAEDRAALKCACGKPLRRDNASGICWECQRWWKRSTRRCSCGCGRTIGLRNRGGLARACRGRMVMTTRAAALAEITADNSRIVPRFASGKVAQKAS